MSWSRPDIARGHPRITVVGCGGAGTNAVHRWSEHGLAGFELCAVGTDSAHLLLAPAPGRILAGQESLRGLGTGGDPDLGRSAVLERETAITERIGDSRIVFVVAGLGGGTGSGGAPEVARMARSRGALTVGIAYLPFRSEGSRRQRVAREGLDALTAVCDQVIVLSNERMLRERARHPLLEAFRWLDGTALAGMRTIAATQHRPEQLGLDDQDLRSVFQGGGIATVGTGESRAATPCATDATHAALRHPSDPLARSEVAGGALLWVEGDRSVTLDDVQRSAELLDQHLPKEVPIVWRGTVDRTAPMQGRARATVLLTGFRVSAVDRSMGTPPSP